MKRNNYKYTKLAFEEYNNAKICVKCYTTKNICIHHRDEDPENNQENNLQILCRKCHNGIHRNRLGTTLSREHKEKISRANKGHISWHKGKKGVYTKEAIKKMSVAKKGRKLTKEAKENMRGTGKLIDGIGVTERCEKTGKGGYQFYKLAK